MVGATVVLALSRTWRIALLALLAHYAALAALVVEPGPVARGGLRVLVGGLICLVLYLTARWVDQSRNRAGRRLLQRRQVSEFGFRLAAVSLAAIGVFGTPVRHWFPALPAELVLASAWLMALGLVLAIVSRDVLEAGLGLLVAESGFETLYTALDPRLVVAGLLAAGGLLLALLVAVIVSWAAQRGSRVGG